MNKRLKVCSNPKIGSRLPQEVVVYWDVRLLYLTNIYLDLQFAKK